MKFAKGIMPFTTEIMVEGWISRWLAPLVKCSGKLIINASFCSYGSTYSMSPAYAFKASMYCVKGISPDLSANGSVNPAVLIPDWKVFSYVPMTRFLQVESRARASVGMDSSRCMRGRQGRPSSRYKNKNLLRILKPTEAVAGRQPVHFISLRTFTSSYGWRQ